MLFTTNTQKRANCFFIKEFEIEKNLSEQYLADHANGYPRYNNIVDLVHSGPEAIQWFIDRANLLYHQNLQTGHDNIRFFYLTVFCKFENKINDQAFPLYDFIRFEIGSNRKGGFGIMFSSQLREYYRDKLEKNLDPFENPIDQLFFKSIFVQDSPKTGILREYPIIMLPRSTSEKPSLTDIYMKNLGLNSESFHPPASHYPFRYFCKNILTSIEPNILLAASSAGQAMFEIVRPHLYPLEDNTKPSFNMKHLEDVKWEQHRVAKIWVNDHQDFVKDLMDLHCLEREHVL